MYCKERDHNKAFDICTVKLKVVSLVVKGFIVMIVWKCFKIVNQYF